MVPVRAMLTREMVEAVLDEWEAEHPGQIADPLAELMRVHVAAPIMPPHQRKQ